MSAILTPWHLRIAQWLDRWHEREGRFAVWISVPEAIATAAMAHGPGDWPWEWNCGCHVVVFHTYGDDVACRRAHPALTQIRDAASIRFQAAALS